MACQHCCTNASFEIDSDEFVFSDEKLIKKRIEEMLSFGVKEFYLSGGEPFLVENLFTIVRLLKKRRVIVSIATNGFCLNREIIKQLSEMKVDMLHVSLDGHLPDIHNALRGGNFFHKVVENLQLIKSYKIPLRIGCIIWKRNENFLEKMVEFCENLRIKELRFSWLIKVGRFQRNPKIYPRRKWIEVMQEIQKLRDKYKNKVKISIHRNPFLQNSHLSICPGGEKLFFLNPKGQLSPCSWIVKIDPSFLTNHSLKQKKFRELVFSKEIEKFRRIVHKRKQLHLQGCPFISRYEYNSYFSNDTPKL